MDSTSSSSVTAKGVRAGDPEALQGLVDRRGPAVLAFCAQVCGPANAARAAAEAFARFRAAVRDAPEPSAVDPETLLLGATRHAAASMARVPSGPPPHGRLRSRNTETCKHVPTMLAARAAGVLGEADLERLARHLDRCEQCAALEEIFRRAEMAYADPSIDELAPDTAALLVAALQAVSAEPPAGLAPPPAPLPPELARNPAAVPPLPEVEEIPAMAAELGDGVGLPLEQVEAGEIHAAALVAEPLPEAPPAVDEHGDDLGATMEWDNELPPGAHSHVHDDEDEDEDEDDGQDRLAGAPVLDGGRERRRGLGLTLRLLLPVAVVAAGIVAALAIAGVFGGNDATPVQEQPAAVKPVNYKPVLTPLPVKVKAAPKPDASGTATTTTPSAAGTTTTQGASATPSTPSQQPASAPSHQQASAPVAGGTTSPQQNTTTTPGGTAAPDEAPAP